MTTAKHRMVGLASAVMFALVLVAASPSLAGAAKSPTDVLKDSDAKVEQITKKKVDAGSPAEKTQDEKLKKVVGKLIDYKAVARSALGKKYWKVAEEMGVEDEFVSLLKQLIENNFIKQIRERTGDKYTITYESEEIDGNKAKVIALVVAEERHDEETEILYKMKKKGKIWIVTDIETDGVSLVRNYRGQFHDIIKEEGPGNEEAGIQKLLDTMETRLEEIKEGKD